MLKEKFRKAYSPSITFDEQYERYQNITEEFALEFARYLDDAQTENELKYIKNCFEKFKKEYK